MYKYNLKKFSCLALTISSVVFTLPSAAFIYQDDPSSTWGGDSSTTRTINGNVVTYQNFYAENLTNNSISSLFFAVPFAWPRIDNAFTGTSTYAPMQWDNNLHGWYASDFNNTGTSLTVIPTSSLTTTGYVSMGDLADGTGVTQLPLTSNAYGLETSNATNNIPLFSLGTFAPNEIKHFDLTFTYKYGNGIGDALPTGFNANTLSAISAVPIPSAVWLMGSGLLGLIGLKRKVI